MGMQLVKDTPQKPNGGYNKKRKSKKGKYIKIAAVAALVLIIAACAGSYFVFRVENIEYLGGTHYEPDELNKIIFETDNPNALYYKLFGKKDKEITFVEKYDVDVEWPDKMTVTVYEKAIIGYISYMGCNMYFDREGIVVESTSQQYENVPEISGLKFTSIVLNSKLELGNDEVFSRILEMTQAFDKYSLDIDKIYFNSSYEVILNMGEVRVLLGASTDSTDKLYVLKQMSSKLEGMKGTLDLREYDGKDASIIFKKDK